MTSTVRQVSLVGLEKALQAYSQGPAEQPFDLRSVPVAETAADSRAAAAPEGSIPSSRKPEEKVRRAAPAGVCARAEGGRRYIVGALAEVLGGGEEDIHWQRDVCFGCECAANSAEGAQFRLQR